METIQKFVLITHTVIALGIIALVLLQRGKGADAGAAFGAGASGTVFGSRGASSFFSRATAVLATAFFASSLTLAYLSSQGSAGTESLVEDVPVVETDTGELPVGTDEIPDSDMPSLDSANDTEDFPALEEEPASDEENQ